MRKMNMHRVDRGIRAVISTGLIILITTSAPVFGSFLITALLTVFTTLNIYATLTGVCLGYSVFHLSTYKQK